MGCPAPTCPAQVSHFSSPLLPPTQSTAAPPLLLPRRPMLCMLASRAQHMLLKGLQEGKPPNGKPLPPPPPLPLPAPLRAPPYQPFCSHVVLSCMKSSFVTTLRQGLLVLVAADHQLVESHISPPTPIAPPSYTILLDKLQHAGRLGVQHWSSMKAQPRSSP